MQLYETKKEQQKKHDAFVKRIFPGGESQQEKDVKLLALILPKAEASVSKYMLITVRDILTNDDDEEDRANQLRSWYGSKMAQYLKPQERALIYAMALMTADCSIDDYPTFEEIKSKGDTLYAGEMAGWPLKVQSHFNLKKIFFGAFEGK